jgi:hypothetical protein
MCSHQVPPLLRGRYLGMLFLVAAQLLVGLIHVVFGVWLFSESIFVPFETSFLDVYGLYTITFGVLTLLFTAGLWLEKLWSWIGTIAVALFVIVVDSLTILDLQSIPGIPKAAGIFEITYSILILIYLMKAHVRSKFGLIIS